MITTNVIRRIFNISYKDSCGTCFAIDVEGRQYIVTANHVVEGITSGDRLQISHDGEWKNICFQVIGIGQGDIDIAVLAADIQLAPTLPLKPDLAGMAYGQNAFFLGFPYGLSGDLKNLNQRFPAPFVKSATVSLISHGDPLIIFLDGHNNPGFSGGPVVFKGVGESDFKVAGVIHGYKQTKQPIYNQDQKTSISYLENTGIIIAYGIKHAVDLINQNPNGFLLPTPAH